MKKVLTLFLFFLGSLFLGFSQEKNDQDFDNLTSGKWQIASVEIGNEVMNVANEGHWMMFYDNGLYQLVLDDEEQVGTWKIDKNDIKFDVENFEGNSYLRKLSDSELKFSISGYTLALTK